MHHRYNSLKGITVKPNQEQVKGKITLNNRVFQQPVNIPVSNFSSDHRKTVSLFCDISCATDIIGIIVTPIPFITQCLIASILLSSIIVAESTFSSVNIRSNNIL